MSHSSKAFRFSLSALACLCLTVPALVAASASATHGVLARVNGVAIPQSESDFLVKQQESRGGKDSPELRDRIRNFLVTKEILAQEAKKEGMDKSADFATELKYGHITSLRAALLDKFAVDHPGTGASPRLKAQSQHKAMDDFVAGLRAKAKVLDRKGTVAMVDGHAIPMAISDFLAKREESRGDKDTPILRTKIHDYLVTQQILANEAVKEGLGRSADFVDQMKLARSDALSNALVVHFVQANPIADAALQAEYKKQVAAVPPQQEYRASHILVKTEAEAQAVMAELKAGKPFDVVAKEKSIDPGSKAKGGDLGWVSPAGLVKPFSDAMVNLKKGEMTQTPVKSQFGYHIIKLVDVRTRPVPTFDQVKDGLRQSMVRAAVDKMIGDLKSKAKVG